MTHAGARQPAFGDLTGRIHAQGQRDKQDWWKAVRETVNSLNAGEPVVLVETTDGDTWAVPRSAYERILEIGAGQ